MGIATTRRPRYKPIDRILSPFQRFARTEASAGLVLLAATLLALAWANSPWSAGYALFRETHLSIGVGGRGMDEPLHGWINDGLMVVFFLLVGLEIKREALYG